MIVKVFDGELVIDGSLIEESEEEVRSQINDFLERERTSFDLEYSYPGGGLGHVLRTMEEIPYGESRTYGELAEELGSSAIAVGRYCSDNPLPLIIPCHRVVGKNDIGGYQAGKKVKQKLLKLEQD